MALELCFVRDARFVLFADTFDVAALGDHHMSNTSLPRVLVAAACAVVVAALSGCQVNRLFHADFQADSVGSAPNTSPPTEPVNDLIWFSSQQRPTVINSTPLQSKALEIKYNAEWGIPVMYFGTTPPNPSNTYYAFWQGYAPTISTVPFTISLTSSHFQPGVQLTFHNGTIYKDIFHTEVSTGAPIGSYSANQVHMVLMTANKSASTYNLWIWRDGAPAIELNNQPITNAYFWDSDRFAITVSTPVSPLSSASAYVMDDPMINQQAPQRKRLTSPTVPHRNPWQ